MNDHLSMMTRLAIGLAMVLWLPRLMERFRVPGILGFILAGVILGPGLTGVLRSDSESITLWAELGKLLFMFFVGFEIDLDKFNQARSKSAYFGALTFALPFAAAIFLGWALGYGWIASVVIGSIIASHTLLAHPILARLGLLERESVLVAISGTIFTDIASMLVLAMAVSVHETGFSWPFLITQLVELAVYVPLVLFGLSKLARKLIIHFGDTAESRVCILLLLIAMAAEMARMIHLEGIVGAFLVGIAVKRAMRGKFAIEQLEVLAKALFIPTFFLATGFLIDLPLLGRTLISRPGVVVGLVGALAVGKYSAAWLASRRWGYPAIESRLMFSITIPQMAATLASAVVGHQAKDASGTRLLEQDFVNAVLVLVVITCVVGPVLTERWGGLLASDANRSQTTIAGCSSVATDIEQT
ncbi:Glutathione-regulated potassium-efflux system protein KefC [Caulifigura coniformis]|uniref:Glutathione-regulated potassium-efflux system protein KefC n=1 Tax=Caulifigura coniformis TaxID=2527983 RepID=A0A517SKB7_9PLAN|nr:cation:proton antiporter [Caulifigura coniformis]QDT56556.1 Glutathione-regulated potassium-efflux system protein KefC [Caulifigura coniformis]